MTERVPAGVYETLKLEVSRLTALVHDLTLRVNAAGGLNQPRKSSDHLLIKMHGANRFVKFHDILFIKAESNYARVYLVNGDSLLTSKTLKFWLEKCNAPFLLRVHRSYIVNISKMLSYHSGTGLIQMEGGITIPYSGNMRKNLQQTNADHHS